MFATLDDLQESEADALSAVWGRLRVFLEVYAEAEERLFYPGSCGSQRAPAARTAPRPRPKVQICWTIPNIALLRALNHARPDTAVSVLRDVLTQQLGATEVRVLLANYQLTAVRPILDGDERVPLDHTAAGAAFTTQEPVVLSDHAGESRLPSGERARRPRRCPPQVTAPATVLEKRLDQLTDLATLAGYALTATSRHTDLLHRAARSRRMTRRRTSRRCGALAHRRAHRPSRGQRP